MGTDDGQREGPQKADPEPEVSFYGAEPRSAVETDSAALLAIAREAAEWIIEDLKSDGWPVPTLGVRDVWAYHIARIFKERLGIGTEKG